MEKVLIATSLLLFSISAFSQNKTFKDLEEVQQFSEKMSEQLYQNKLSASFSEMKDFWPLPSNEIDDLQEKTIRYFNVLDERFGKRIGVSKVKVKTISDFAIQEIFMIRFKYSAIRLIYTYYKNDEGWILNSFRWDDSFKEEFE